MRRFSPWTWMLGMTLCLPGGAVASPGAVIVLEETAGFEGFSSSGVLDQVQRQVSRRWRIRTFQDLPGLVEREPRCAPGPRREQAQRIAEEIQRALDTFFREIDPDQTRERLGAALETVRALPCLAPEEPLRQPLAEAGLLQVRLLLMDGRPEAATAVARDLLQWWEYSRLPLEHVPPEVSEFLGRIIRDRESAEVQVTIASIPDGWALLMDGFPVPTGREWKVVAGRHRLDLLSPEDAFQGVVEALPGAFWSFQEELSRAYLPGPKGTLWAASGNGEEQDRRLARVYGVDVLRMRVSNVPGTCRVEVTASDRDLPRQEVLWIDLRDLSEDRMQVVRKGVLVQQVPWYWAPLTGALSLALVATGVALNVEANRTMDSMIQGEDRLGTWRSQRQGSIASYSLGAALGVAAAALTWASHGMPSRSTLRVSDRQAPSASDQGP